MNTKKHTIALSTGERLTADEGQTVLQALTDFGIPLRSDCGGKGICGKCLVQVNPPDGKEAVEGSEAPLLHKACKLIVGKELNLTIPETSIARAEVISKPVFRSGARNASIPSKNSALSGAYGLAVDLGTTTIAAYLCDLGRGEVLSSGAIKNPQFIYGADVISRINAASMNSTNLGKLQKLVIRAIHQVGVSLAEQQQVKPEKIQKVMVTGNSTMTHLLLGVDPSPIGKSPFKPAFTDGKTVKAEKIGLFFHKDTTLHTLPLISGFLGSDIISAAMAIEIDKHPGNVMVIDVGTNGEIMINSHGVLYGTSCATGPAFEGAAIGHGVLAISGAIDSVSIGPKMNRGDGSETGEYAIEYSLIQNDRKRPRKAAGICGSGIVSAAAELYRAGLIESSGRFSYRSDSAEKVSNFHRNRDGVLEFSLVPGRETQSGEDITLTQKDIRAIQLAKGAIFTGITSLCKKVGITHPAHLYIAGAFGNYLDKDDAMTIGILPKLKHNMIDAVGNAAGEGAILALLDQDFTERAKEIAGRTRVLDLASHPDFQKAFTQSLLFP